MYANDTTLILHKNLTISNIIKSIFSTDKYSIYPNNIISMQFDLRPTTMENNCSVVINKL